jgi:hypothetical protein
MYTAIVFASVFASDVAVANVLIALGPTIRRTVLVSTASLGQDFIIYYGRPSGEQ